MQDVCPVEWLCISYTYFANPLEARNERGVDLLLQPRPHSHPLHWHLVLQEHNFVYLLCVNTETAMRVTKKIGVIVIITYYNGTVI